MSYPSNFIDTTGMTMEGVKQACPNSLLLSQIWECRNGIDCWTKQCYRFHIGDCVVEPPDGVCPYHFYNYCCKWNDKKKQNPNNPRFKPCKYDIHICQNDYIEQIEEKIKWEKENIDVLSEFEREIDNDVVEEKEGVPPLDDSDGYDSVEVVDTDDEGANGVPPLDNKENVPPLLSDIAKKLNPSPEVIWEKCAWLDEYEEQ
jgi:hypothetical protein